MHGISADHYAPKTGFRLIKTFFLSNQYATSLVAVWKGGDDTRQMVCTRAASST